MFPRLPLLSALNYARDEGGVVQRVGLGTRARAWALWSHGCGRGLRTAYPGVQQAASASTGRRQLVWWPEGVAAIPRGLAAGGGGEAEAVQAQDVQPGHIDRHVHYSGVHTDLALNTCALTTRPRHAPRV